jgi:hypothetical protein
MAQTYAFWYRQRYNLPPNSPLFLTITPEEIEAEWWAVHYEQNTTGMEFDDDDEGAADAYLQTIIREAEAAEAAVAATGSGAESASVTAPINVPEGEPDPFEVIELGSEPDISGIPDNDWQDSVPPMRF